MKPKEAADNGERGVVRIPRAHIRPDPKQPRTHFDKASLRELADSIEEIGQVTPVEVRPLPKGDTHSYELVDGERRWIACGMRRIDSLLAWINDVADDEEKFIRSVVANFGREGHTPLETARAVTRILDGERLKDCANRSERIAKVARMFARSPAWVYQHLNILNLHPDVQALMEPDVPEPRRISFSIGVFLNTIPDKELQLEIAKEVSEGALKLREARRLARKKAEEAGLRAGSRDRRPSDHYRSLDRFLTWFGTNVEEILEMPAKSFAEIFRRKSPKQQEAVLARIDDAVERLDELRQALRRAKGKTAAA